MKKGIWQSEPEEKRNKKIVELYRTGSYTYRSLGRMFKLSTSRMHEIFHRWKGVS
jgi:hypothetical protein